MRNYRVPTQVVSGSPSRIDSSLKSAAIWVNPRPSFTDHTTLSMNTIDLFINLSKYTKYLPLAYVIWHILPLTQTLPTKTTEKIPKESYILSNILPSSSTSSWTLTSFASFFMSLRLSAVKCFSVSVSKPWNSRAIALLFHKSVPHL